MEAFVAVVRVAEDGPVGVTYYDFRHWRPGSEILDTDHWLVQLGRSRQSDRRVRDDRGTVAHPATGAISYFLPA